MVSRASPVLFTANLSVMDVAKAIVAFTWDSRAPFTASKVRPRWAPGARNGWGTKVMMRMTTAAMPTSFRRVSRGVRSLRGGGCRTPRMKIRKPKRNQPG